MRTVAKTADRRERSLRVTVVMAVFVLLLGLGLVWAQVSGVFDRREYRRGYEAFVEQSAASYDIPANLLYAVIHTESDFDALAVSGAGAAGLMQLMPATFRWLSDDMLGERLPDSMIYDPATNIRYGTYYLRRLYDRYGSWVSACAAYNAGHSRVDEWLADPDLTDKDGHLIIDRIPITETKNYIRRIARALEAYEDQVPSASPIVFE